MTDFKPSSSFPALLMFTDMVDSSVHSALLGMTTYTERILKFDRLFHELGNVWLKGRVRVDRES